MKFKYINTEVQNGANASIVDNNPIVTFTANVKWEIIETETTIPDEYKFIVRTAPKFSVDTDSVIYALSQVDVLGLQWLQDTFGAANVVTE